MKVTVDQLIDADLCEARSFDAADLISISHHIGEPFLGRTQNNDKGTSKCIICILVDLQRRIDMIKSSMGCMAQCRGARGESLREAGALDSLLNIICRLISSPNCDDYYSINLPEIEIGNTQSSTINNNENAFGVDYCKRHSNSLDNNNDLDFDTIAINELHPKIIELASVALGSLRDLACGSALNRANFLSWEPPTLQTFNGTQLQNGTHVLVAYVQRYMRLNWEDILHLDESMTKRKGIEYTKRGRKELRMLTNALGVIRNSSHSTADVCQSFYSHGIVDLLIARLIPKASTSNDVGLSVLPDSSKPWREACFRTAGSLINLSEKCPDVAMKLASDRRIIYILLETWGGLNAITSEHSKKSRLPLLHLGLAAVLNAAAANGEADDVMLQVLDKEKERKKVAQRREEQRKLKMKL